MYVYVYTSYNYVVFALLCSGCKDNGALYQVALLDQRYKLDLENALNISRVSQVFMVKTIFVLFFLANS